MLALLAMVASASVMMLVINSWQLGMLSINPMTWPQDQTELLMSPVSWKDLR